MSATRGVVLAVGELVGGVDNPGLDRPDDRGGGDGGSSERRRDARTERDGHQQ
jgi:hypothetical protein